MSEMRKERKSKCVSGELCRGSNDASKRSRTRRLTVAEDPVKLILGEKSEPVDSVLLVLPELSLDRNGDLVLVDLGSVEELVEELSLSSSFLEHLEGESWWVGDSGLGKPTKEKVRKGRRQDERFVEKRTRN